MTPEPLYPLRFEPIFKSALWGGRRLASMFPGAPAEGPIAEAWVLSDQGENVSRVAEGPLAGTTLRELMRERREDLLGSSLAHYDTFPLLLKFIDAREHLSVQVHPDDELAQTLAAVPRGKTEAWVVLHAEPGSRIFAGLKAGVDRARLERAVVDGTAADLLHSFAPTVGDCVYLPAGTVHALGGGITVFEVQQTSDTTYRLFDWNRVDAKTGKPRDLHIEKALASTNFAQGPIRPAKPTGETSLDWRSRWTHGWSALLVDCPYFTLRYTNVNNWPYGLGLPPNRLSRTPGCCILVALQGTGTLCHTCERETVLHPNDVVLVPADMSARIDPHGKVSFLEIWPK